MTVKEIQTDNENGENSFLFVFVSEIPDGDDLPEVISPSRLDYLYALKNRDRARESGYAWRLLERGVETALGIPADRAAYSRLSCGRWASDAFRLSLSHTKGACAAAVSSSEVGVDVELIREPRSDSFPRRALTKAEYREYERLADGERVDFLIQKWTEKEASYKAGGDDVTFVPGTEPQADGLHTEILELSGRRYSLSVCAKNIEKLKIIFFPSVNFTPEGRL